MNLMMPLIPINLSNTHWILIHFDLKNSTFFPINPYHPQNPSIYEIQIAGEMALKISQQYGLQEPVLRSPDYCHCLPVQHPSDSINCGVYVCLYMVIHVFGSFSKKNVGNLLPATIDQCRFLILSWMLRGEIFFLP